MAAGLLVGAYRTSSTSDLPSALRVASLTWLIAMPVAAAQLVLATAVESRWGGAGRDRGKACMKVPPCAEGGQGCRSGSACA